MIKTKNKKLPHATSIDLSAETRASVVGLLNQQLANVSDLYSQTKQAHWNVRGPEFYQVHKLFDDLAAPLQEMIDELAERAVTIGGFALGTVRCAANLSELEEFPLEPGAMLGVTGFGLFSEPKAVPLRLCAGAPGDIGIAAGSRRPSQ